MNLRSAFPFPFCIPVFGPLFACAGLVSAPGRALAADATPHGPEVGWRTGFALPMGDAVASPGGGQRSLPLGDVVTGALPFWIDAGYRVSPNTFVGVDFAYAHALVSSRQGCPLAELNCAANEVVAGGQVHYHPLPDHAFDPWGGLSVNYEVLNVSTQLSGGAYFGAHLGLQLGGDYRPTPAVAIGPFATFAFGSFLGCTSSSGAPCRIAGVGLHEWLTVGLRAVYDIHFVG